MLDGGGWPAAPAMIESRIGVPTKVWVVEVSAVSVGVGNRPEGTPTEALLGGLLGRIFEGFVGELATRLPGVPVPEVLNELMLRLLDGSMARALDGPIRRLLRRVLWTLLEVDEAGFRGDEEELAGKLICDVGALPELRSAPVEDWIVTTLVTGTDVDMGVEGALLAELVVVDDDGVCSSVETTLEDEFVKRKDMEIPVLEILGVDDATDVVEKTLDNSGVL